MKKQTRLFFVLACLVMTGCGHYRGNTNIAFNESEDYYSMRASFEKNKTREVERYMDRKLRSLHGKSFINMDIDGTLTFDDHTSFYIKKYDGYLKIKLDKYKNSRESYEKIRDMCQGIKEVLGN